MKIVDKTTYDYLLEHPGEAERQDAMNELMELRTDYFASLLYFTRVFFRLRTGRDFIVSQPVSRESPQITICKAFTKVFRLQSNRLLINIAPGTGKSELCKHFIAWALARYPDSNFLYISYSYELAVKHTAGIRDIIEMPAYQKIFGVKLNPNFSAKDNFKTTKGGCIAAFGSSGSITGQDAGLPNLDRFSGCVIMDDMHKPDEVHSDTIRGSIKDNYQGTIVQRPRGINVPIIFIGQRLHEDDLPAMLMSGKADGYQWDKVILKSIDNHNNVLYPEIYPKERLLNLKESSPYQFAAQHQQDPQPAGGGIFKEIWFKLLDEEPKVLATFITADTAETDKTYNDPTVFSFWGVYRIMHGEVETDMYGLHWIDCLQVWIEPADLESNFMAFYADCMRFHVKPDLAAIEKKSSGVTLVSVLKKYQGLEIIEIDRTRASGSKTTRFLEMQPFVSIGLISLPRIGKHTNMCVEHMGKITANDSHRHDDIADTLYDAVKMALIDKTIVRRKINTQQEYTRRVSKKIISNFDKVRQLKRAAYYGNEYR